MIYPVTLYYKPQKGESNEHIKEIQKILKAIDCSVVGLSIGIPMIRGMHAIRIKYKVNKQKWLEIFGADNIEDFTEIDETIPEE